MCFVEYKKIKAKYESEVMTENINRLEEFDEYQYLLPGSISSALRVKELCKKCPKQFLDWAKVCDGGLLFDTVLLSTKSKIESLDIEVDTFEDYNDKNTKNDYGLSDDYFIIAIRSYGDPICINCSEDDEKVYLWDAEKQEFTDIWNTFEDWLAEEIDDGIVLIAEEALEPLPIKEGGEYDE